MENQISETIKSAPIVVFAKEYCGYCAKALRLLNEIHGNKQIKVIQLDRIENGSQIQDALYQLTGQGTVPNIFIGQKHIGGCDSVHALHSKNQLVPLIEAA